MRSLLILAALLLAACAGGPMGEPQPLGPARIEANTIRGAATLPLTTYHPEAAPKAAILALHGFGDYGPSTYGDAAAYWAARGIITYTYDQRGFGRGETRGRWPGADTLITDAQDAAAVIRAAHPDIPLIIIGHSMGGGVALAAVGEGAVADGLILAAPAVWGGDQLAPPYRLTAWAGATFFPNKRWTGEGIVRIQASDNIEMLRRLGADRYYLRNPSSREFMGLIRIMDRAIGAAPKVAIPTLTLWGEKDQVLARGPIDAAHGQIEAEKQMIVYPEGWHLLFRDLQAKTVWRDVADWIEDMT